MGVLSVDEIFPNSTPGSTVAGYGVLLAVLVTVLATVQLPGVGGESFGFPASGETDELRMLVFGFHLATVAAVYVETRPSYRGTEPLWSHLVIGSGLVATLAQVAVVAVAAGTLGGAGFQWAFALLALQIYANSLMVALLIAEAWASRKSKSSSSPVSAALLGGF